MKFFPVVLPLLLGLVATAPRLEARPAPDQKNRVNLEIDQRLGWIGSDAPPLKPAPAVPAAGLPNYFTWESSRFMQPGPPPYAEQPENLDDVSLAFALAEGTLPDLPASQITKIVRQIGANPAIRGVVPAISPAAVPEGFVAVETPSGTVQLVPTEQVAAASAAGSVILSDPNSIGSGYSGGGVTISSGSLSFGGATLTLGGASLSGGGTTGSMLSTAETTLGTGILASNAISSPTGMKVTISSGNTLVYRGTTFVGPGTWFFHPNGTLSLQPHP